MTLTVRSASVTGATTAARALTHAEMDANWAHVIQSANQNYLPSGSGAVARTLQSKGRDVVNLADFLPVGFVVDASVDYSANLQSAINSIDTSGGKGGTVIVPNGAFSIGTTTITGKSNVRLVGAGRRATIFNYTGTAAAFQFDGTFLSGLIGARISPGTSGTSIGLNLLTTSAGISECVFDDLEIAGVNTAGQIGIQAIASGGQTIIENIFGKIFMTGIAKPIVKTSCEGNQWYGIVIASYGNGASPAAVQSTTCHNDWMDVRIAGIGGGVTTPIAFNTSDDRSITKLSADVGGTGKAINSTGSKNVFLLSRASGTTPIGTLSSSDTVIDPDITTTRRIAGAGTALVAGDFQLSAGWGATATVTAVSGTDQRFSFTINSTGGGQGANPTVTLTYKDGAWPSAPFTVIGRAGGNQVTINLFPNSPSTTVPSFIFAGTPVNGEVYVFTAISMG